MNYTVKKLAEAAKISIRTLHYYDQIGLLKPSFKDENNYRYYGEYEFLKLQQILFFQELDFPLSEIKKIINDPHFNIKMALSDQKEMLILKEKRTRELIDTIEQTIDNLSPIQVSGYIGFRKDCNMKTEELFESFEENEITEYKKEAKERWGASEAYKTSMLRTAGWNKEDWDLIKRDSKELNKAIVANMNKGVESEEIQTLIGQHRKQINKFYDCTLEIYRGLAEMYVSDERFAKHYRKWHKDLPEFLSEAMLYYCKNNK